MKNRDDYKSLFNASKVRWKHHLKKSEQMKFLQKLSGIGKSKNKHNFMKFFLWKNFFPMVSYNLFMDLYNIKEMKSKHLANLDKHLLTHSKIRGGCIFTLLAGVISSIAAAASAAATTVAGGVSAIAGAVASSSIASAATVGLVTGAATAIGEKIVTAI